MDDHTDLEFLMVWARISIGRARDFADARFALLPGVACGLMTGNPGRLIRFDGRTGQFIFNMMLG